MDCKMDGSSPGHCKSVSSGEILRPFLQPGLKGRLWECWVKGGMLLWVRNHLRPNRRKNDAEVLTAGHNRDVYRTWYYTVYLFMSWKKKKGEQMNSKTCKCLRYLWVSQEKRWKTSQGFSPDKAGRLSRVLVSREAKTKSMLHVGRSTGSMLRSKLAVTI